MSAPGNSRQPRKTVVSGHMDRFTGHHPNNAQIARFLQLSGCRVINVRRASSSIRLEPWQLVVRLPKALEEEFGFSRELLMVVTGWLDFRVKDLESIRTVVAATDRVEPEIAILVCDDPDASDKAFEWLGNDFTLIAVTHQALKLAAKSDSEASVAALRSALQAGLFGRNFYDESGPVSGERFFGRSNTLTQIRSDFANHRTVGLFGLRKIGKTSILQQSIQRAEASDIAIYIDLGGERIHRDSRHILATFLDRISTTYPDIELPSLRWEDGADRFTTAIIEWLDRQLGRFDQEGRRMILALDEIEAILPTADREGLPYWEEVLAALRSLWQGHQSFQIAFAGVNPSIFELPSVGDRDNPVFAFVRPTYVQCMSRPEFDRMVVQLGKRTGVSWHSDILDRLYSETGGHPYLSRQVCAHVVAGVELPAMIPYDLLDDRLAEFALLRSDVFNEIFDSLRRHFPEELKALQRIVRSGGRAAQEMRSTELRHLLGYELVTLQRGIVRPRVGLIEAWLKARS